MSQVSFGEAWKRAWQHAPDAVRECTLMTRLGMPIGKLRDHGVLRVVLGENAPAALIGRQRVKTVSTPDAELLLEVVKARGAELDACRQLFEQVQEARLRLRLVPRGDAEANSMIVRELYEQGILGRAEVDAAVRRHFAPRIDFDEQGRPIDAADALRAQQEQLQAAWPTDIPPPSPDALNKPKGLLFWHDRVDPDHWQAAVNWVASNELRGHEQALGLTDSEQISCPPVTGPSDGLQPLDRPLQSWTTHRTRDASDAPLPRREIIAEEIRCATSPLGLPTDEARTVILLGYWLVAYRSFDMPTNQPGLAEYLPGETMVAAVRDGRAEADEGLHSQVRFVLMMRVVWKRIRGLHKGTIDGPEKAVRLTDKNEDETRTQSFSDAESLHDDAEVFYFSKPTLGQQKLEMPLRSFMKRLWPSVHAQSHRGAIASGVATRLLRTSWLSWVKDVVSDLARPAIQAPPEDEYILDEILMLQLQQMAPSDAEVIKQVAVADDLAALADAWQAAIKAARIDPVEAAHTRLADLDRVRTFLRDHLRLAETEKGS